MSQPDALARANAEQLEASDPTVSAFVAASAGSGKTKLLTDRLLRLMLAGADPQRIQCLTFTKAAAAEMAVRLQRTLGSWVTLDDAALDAKLRDLRVPATPESRQTARALFAHVLDLPGGMRIGTIHAFCQSLLRRFPLEAQLSPHFRVVEETDARLALTEAREGMLGDITTDRARDALDQLAGLATADGFGDLVASLQFDRERLMRLLAVEPEALAGALFRLAGSRDEAPEDMLHRACDWPEAAVLRGHLAAVLEHPKTSETMRGRLAALLDWLGLPALLRAERWTDWHAHWLTGEGTARQHSAFYPKAQAAGFPGLTDACTAEQARVLAMAESVAALRVARASAALLLLAVPVLRAYAARKDQTGLLDYSDLIGLTSGLLEDPGAAWVLFKLDGGLDHLLLDEVQDTAPAQWDIAHRLTEEFFAGEGAGRGRRTVFAVGDRKQSIYSFQGADIASFDESRQTLRQRVERAGQVWRDTALDVSFRSAEPVLRLVDSVFADPVACAGVAAAASLRHHAIRAGHAGRVEIWPLAPREVTADRAPWAVLDTNEGLRTAPQLLADHLADWIAAQTGGAVRLDSQDRPLAPGDVLILLRRRSAAPGIVSALKTRGVPVAGLDRLVLTDQPVVQDLLALCDTLLLPQDDLSLACVLTSPLGGLDDASLQALAVGRRGTLWDSLRRQAASRPDWQAAWTFVSTLLGRVDYAAPHALLVEALGPLGGRARLLARLGAEAAEPLDELLGAALAYARANPPALQGFVQWLRQSGAEVKREADGAGGVVRVMTVHGAKGLQAPLVILPDTVALPPDRDPLVWARDAVLGIDLPLWTPRKAFSCAATVQLQQDRARRAAEEQNRLLYVALTRAEDRLVICGYQPRSLPERCWYSLVLTGFQALPGVVREPFGAWQGEALVLESSQLAPPAPRRAAALAELAAQPPGWAGCAPLWRPAAPPEEPPAAVSLVPSRPEGVELGAVPRAASPLSARDAAGSRFVRGTLVHALLQHLPDVPAEARAAAAAAYLARPGLGLTAAVASGLAEDVLAVLAHPALAPLFGPGSRAEVPLTGVVAGRIVGGLVDRLAVLPDAVLVADFKTNRDPPARMEDTPVAYLRQLAAYRAVLRAIYPDRPVRCALVWTQGARVHVLPDGLLERHAPVSGANG